MIRLAIFKQAPVRIPRKQIKKLFEKIAGRESPKTVRGKINLIFVKDKQIIDLNRNFRKKDKATDVLSFNIDSSIGQSATIGEIYISIDTARRQAKEYNVKLNTELLRLACHGLLHLFGFDHIKKGDRNRMEAKENYYLNTV